MQPGQGLCMTRMLPMLLTGCLEERRQPGYVPAAWHHADWQHFSHQCLQMVLMLSEKACTGCNEQHTWHRRIGKVTPTARGNASSQLCEGARANVAMTSSACFGISRLSRAANLPRLHSCVTSVCSNALHRLIDSRITAVAQQHRAAVVMWLLCLFSQSALLHTVKAHGLCLPA